MAGLIVAGYDAVHKQGQVKHPSLNYNFSSGQVKTAPPYLNILESFAAPTNPQPNIHPSQVWCVPIGGMCVRQPMTIGGSGSSYLYGMMDHTYRVSLTFSVIILFIYLIFFRIICPRKSARIWFCRLLPRLIYHTYYGLRPQTIELQRSHGSYFIYRSAGNQERRQLWRMLQDGNYHQGESVKR